MSGRFRERFSNYAQWRKDLLGAIEAYRVWMDQAGGYDAQQALRIYDLAESLKKERLVLAFVAEFSRGKTELVNALFFADFGQRLLPSDVGRTTMCPTEVFYDPEHAPYLRLLPIETRLREESIAAFKRMPVEWSRIRLDPADREGTLAAMRRLTETKTVPAGEAHALGLTEERPVAADAAVEIPAWRYAQFNYPHPLLESGLVVLDTPGLNALGAEPELTLSEIPNAHAVLFLLATDTGVTKSDREIWDRYLESHAQHRLAVLNKIDVLWDDLKTWEEIQSGIRHQVQETAKQLGLPPSRVFALSAQRALLAKIRGDAALLRKSGIEDLEIALAEEIIPAKQDIVRDAVAREIGGMVETSRLTLRTRLAAARHEETELSALSGKNREVMGNLRDRLLSDKVVYDGSVKNFNLTRNALTLQKKALRASLSEQRLQEILHKSREAMQGSWTTAGLSRGMHALVRGLTLQFNEALEHSRRIHILLHATYRDFHEKHQFPRLSPPHLNLEPYRERLLDLARKTDEFCRDPVNIMTEKHFLINRFYLALAALAERVFREARRRSEAWFGDSLDPLATQIKEYKVQLERRLENIRKIHEHTDTLQERIGALHVLTADLERQSALLGDIGAQLLVRSED